MKLFLLRHAHAIRKNGTEDLNRVLSHQGKHEASNGAKFVSSRNYEIDKIISSPSKRTKQTADYFKQHSKKQELHIIEGIYNADDNDIVDVISLQNDNCKSLMIVGHNPTIHYVAIQLANEQSDHYKTLLSSEGITARIVVMEFPHMTSWSNIYDYKHKGSIIDIYTPEL